MRFAANAVRLQLHALAYNLANFLRTLAARLGDVAELLRQFQNTQTLLSKLRSRVALTRCR
jgi:hypothetical protein